MADDVEREPAPPLVAAAEAAFTRAHAANLEASIAAKDASLTNWLEAFESEHAGVLQAVLPRVLAHPDMPPVVRDVLGSITDPAHQTQVILGMAAVYAIVSGFVSAAIQPEMQDVANVSWKLNPSAPLSASDMALALLRHNVEQGAAEKEASLTGITADRLAVLVANTGEPPGVAELLEAYRRGFIDEGELAKGVRQSRVRDEWLPVIEKLRYAPVPASEVLDAAVQNHLSQADGAVRLSYAGLNPDDWDWLYATHGRPPGIGELEQLVNRGELDIGTLEQAIRESDIKDKYIPELVKLRRKIPPMRSIVSAIHQGVLTEQAGTAKLMQLGYNAEDAAMFAKEGAALKHSTTKALTQAQIHALYSERLITRAAADTMLSALGFDATEVGFILALADHERAAKAQASAVARVHTRYVAYKIDRNGAVTALDKIGVDPAGRTDLLGAWDDERATNAPQFTLAQLDGMIHRGLISQSTYRAHVLRLGYTDSDVPLLYELAFPPTKPGPKWEP